jgi:hypothetical protein
MERFQFGFGVRGFGVRVLGGSWHWHGMAHGFANCEHVTFAGMKNYAAVS